MRRCNIALETLVNYYEDRLEPAERASLQTHLESGCAACQENLQWIGVALPALAGASFVAPPEAAVQEVKRIFRERLQTQGGALANLRERIAELMFDSRQTATAGVRNAEESAFQQLYTTDAYDVDLWGEPDAPNAYYVIGQVRSKESGEAVIPTAIALERAQGAPIYLLPDTPEFHLPQVPLGVYSMRLQLSDTTITLPEIVLER